ncbi:MAG: hypothetical protein M3Y59_20375 [Myxococcota bacterium]|nr:hypothetical protein [Myxococcota bacterium]
MPPLTRFPLLVATTALGVLGISCVTPDCRQGPQQQQFILVEARTGQTSGIAPQVDVVSTPAHDALRKTVKTVALKAPDTCQNETAASATGSANTSQTVMGTNCGVWASEFERVLSSAGYRVISWSALLLAERQNKLSTYVAAKQLGAELVFNVNSLDFHPRNRAGASSAASFRYFDSDRAGNRKAPLKLPSEQRRLLSGAAAQFLTSGPANEVVALGATLDLTVVHAETGQAVWFYRHVLTKPIQSADGRRFLFARPLNTSEFTPVRPDLPQLKAQMDSDLSSEDSYQSERSATADNVLNAVRLDLIRTVTRDSVQRFQEGKQ